MKPGTLQDTISALDVVLAIVDEKMVTTYVSPRFVEMFSGGFSDDTSGNILVAFPIIDGTKIADALRKTLSQGKSQTFTEVIDNRRISGRVTKTLNGAIIFAEDTTFKRMVERKLGRKLELEKVLTSITERLLTKEFTDESMLQTLAEIGLLLDADRTLLFTLTTEDLLILKQGWRAIGIDPLRSCMDGKEKETIPWLISTLENGKVFAIADVQQVQEEAYQEKQLLIDDQVKSTVFIPLLESSKLRWIIRVDEIHHSRSWDEDDVRQLQVIGQILSGSLSRIRVEKTLRQSEERYRTLVEESLQGIMIVDTSEYNVVFQNSALMRILGYNPNDTSVVFPTALEQLVHWSDRQKLKNLLKQISEFSIESARDAVRFTSRNDELIWLDMSLTIINHEGTSAILATLFDVTESRRTMAELVDRNRDLKLYTSLLRHDMKNDLQAIFSNSEAIQLIGSDNDMIKEFAESNVAAVERILSVLDIFGRPDKDMERHIAPFLEHVAVEAARSYSGMKCSLSIDPEIVMTRIVGGILLPMVFYNLLRNAAKYAGTNPRVQIHAYRENRYIIVRIADDGPGIAEEIKSRLFQKGVTTEGTGLGLYLSKKVLHAYGGEIELGVPKNDEGAVFIIRLSISEETISQPFREEYR